MIKKFLTLLFFSLLLTSCRQTKIPTPKPLPIPENKPSSGNSVPYPASVVQNFMNSCLKNSGSQESCSCTIDKIQNQYSLEEFNLLEVKMSVNKTVPDDFLNLIAQCRLSSSQENSTRSDNLPNPIEKPKSPSSVNYYEKLKDYLPPDEESKLYEISPGKTDEGIDINFYVFIDRFTIPYVTGVNVLAHRADTDVCKAWLSFDILEESGEVYSLLDKEATPEELSEGAELVYQNLKESPIVLSPVNPDLLSCDRMPLFLLQHYERALEN